MRKMFRDFIALWNEAHQQKYHKHNENAKCVGALLIMGILAVIAGIHLVRLIGTGDLSHLYTFLTLVVMIGLTLTCALVILKKKNHIFYNTVLSITIVVFFTYYCIVGTCEGLGMVWLLLVPMFAITMIDLAIGLGISLYFLVLGCVMFFGFNDYFSSMYSYDFMVRYPYLIVSDIIISLIVGIENYIYSYKVERQTYIDSLTNLGNRNLYNEKIKVFEKKGYNKDLCVLLFDINGLRYTNDNIGHHAGDELLIVTATCIDRYFGDIAKITCRRGSDEFYVLVNCQKEDVLARIKKFNEVISSWKGEFCNSISVAVGYALWCEHEDSSINYLEIIAENYMYEDKKRYGIQHRSFYDSENE